MEQTNPKSGQYEMTKLVHDDDHDPRTPTADDERHIPLLQEASDRSGTAHSFQAWHNHRHGKGEQFRSIWWWVELGSSVMTVVSISMTVLVLAYLDNTLLDDWRYHIQPSSLLSTLTTIGKMGMTTVLASCVSQLRWMHFQKPNRLSHLEVFDKLSKGGVSGASMMLWTMRKTLLKSRLDIIAMMFALVQLGSFAIDPMIQQVLIVRQHDLQLHNTTASIGCGNNYTSKATLELSGDSTGSNVSSPLILQMTLLNQLTSASIQPELSCPSPSTRCIFRDITTLGLCHNYSDVTNISKRSCSAHRWPTDKFKNITPAPPENYINCTYSVDGITPGRNLTINFGGTDGATYDSFRSILDVIETWEAKVTKPFDFARLFTIRVNSSVESDEFLRNTTLPVPTYRITMSNWYWCEQSYKNVVMNHLDGKLTGMTNASTSPLVVESTGGNDGYDAIWEFASIKTNYYTNFLIASFMDHFFLLDTKLPQYLNPNNTGSSGNSPQVYTGGQAGQGNDTLENYTKDLFGMTAFMSTANMSELTQSIATAITNQVLSSFDNQHFTTANGTAWVDAAYYHVRWGWIVLPLVEAVATAVLLGITILLNRLPLLKSSTIALLAHGLEDAAYFEVNGIETAKKWEKVGETINVTWMDDEKGRTRLTRAL